MRVTKIALLILAIAIALYILIPGLSWAEDRAALYKSKYSTCHDPDGADKPAAKIPCLISDDAKKRST